MMRTWNTDKETDSRESYERLRLSTYYAYLLVPSYSKSAQKKSYNDFKRDYFRMEWDEFEIVPIIEPADVDWGGMEQESIELEKTATIKVAKIEELPVI